MCCGNKSHWSVLVIPPMSWLRNLTAVAKNREPGPDGVPRGPWTPWSGPASPFSSSSFYLFSYSTRYSSSTYSFNNLSLPLSPSDTGLPRLPPPFPFPLPPPLLYPHSNCIPPSPLPTFFIFLHRLFLFLHLPFLTPLPQPHFLLRLFTDLFLLLIFFTLVYLIFFPTSSS